MSKVDKIGWICCLAAAVGFSAVANAGSLLGPDAPVHLAQSKGKGGGTPPGQNGTPPGGGSPPGGTPPGQGGTPPGQTPPGQTGDTEQTSPAPTNHESGVHGTHGRDSGAFGSPSGQRGTREVPEGR